MASLKCCLLLLLGISQALSANAAVQQQSSPDYRTASGHRNVWPSWHHDRPLHERHDRRQSMHHESSARPSAMARPWSREGDQERMFTTVGPRVQVKASRHHVEQRFLEQKPAVSGKFSAVAVAELGGTRAFAYAGYHNNHRHQQREAVTQNYQRVSTTPPTYTRHHSGRRVCSSETLSPAPHHHRGRQIRLVYTELSSGFLCCPGWTQVTRLSFGCNKPTCAAPCLNGGVCRSPGKCTCPKGYTGSQCQTDVDECVTEKPCGQLCRNLPGSYECHCRSGFHLQQDGQSCRKNDSDGTAFEARDLENDFHEPTTSRTPSTSVYDAENEVGDSDLDQDYEIILKRLTKLEKQVAKGRKRDTEASDMSARISLAVESINEMKRTVDNVQLMQQEIYDLRNKLKQYELESRKIQHLTNRVTDLENRLRMRCSSVLPVSGMPLRF